MICIGIGRLSGTRNIMRTLRINDKLLLESQSSATSAAVSILVKVRKKLWTARFPFAVFWFV